MEARKIYDSKYLDMSLKTQCLLIHGCTLTLFFMNNSKIHLLNQAQLPIIFADESLFPTTSADVIRNFLLSFWLSKTTVLDCPGDIPQLLFLLPVLWPGKSSTLGKCSHECWAHLNEFQLFAVFNNPVGKRLGFFFPINSELPGIPFATNCSSPKIRRKMSPWGTRMCFLPPWGRQLPIPLLTTRAERVIYLEMWSVYRRTFLLPLLWDFPLPFFFGYGMRMSCKGWTIAKSITI